MQKKKLNGIQFRQMEVFRQLRCPPLSLNTHYANLEHLSTPKMSEKSWTRTANRWSEAGFYRQIITLPRFIP